MPDPDEFYRGREQSQIKHFILKRYLTDMAFKVAQSRAGGLTAINYVDGFSGPWETQGEAEYEDTSFRQAISVLRDVRAELTAQRGAELPIRFIFCETNPDRYKKLDAAVSADSDLEIHCILGQFEEQLDKISRICSDGFTFTFIDPTGFKIGTHEISKFLQKHRGEFLWNYMADHANRFLTRAGLEEAYGSLLDDQRWADRINDPALVHLRNEERVLVVLRERLKELDCADYILDFPVFRPRQNRIQFRLLFGTRSPVAVAVFRSAQKKAEQFQVTKREELKQEAGGPLLISPEMCAESFLYADGIDGSVAKSSAVQRVTDYLAEHGTTPFCKLLAPVLETERLTETGLKDLLVEMRKAKRIAYDLPARKRKPQRETLLGLP